MELPIEGLLDIFSSKGMENLFHANTVATSCTYIRENALLSREAAELLALPQTPQKTDDLDKKYGIWNDIFFDSTDVHYRANTRNKYGPILFKFDITMLYNLVGAKFRVTKLNPTKWAGKTESQRWFQSIGEVKSEYQVGRFDHMLMVMVPSGQLPFDNNLREITIDFPNASTPNKNIPGSIAWGALRCAMAIKRKEFRIVMRNCTDDCGCHAQYKHDQKMSRQMFDPAVMIGK